MERTILSCIEDSVRAYALAISTVLGMDVDIVDERLVRIAGAGRFESGIGAPIDGEGDAFKWVLAHGRTLLVEHPGEDAVCAACPLWGRCPELYEVCCPIVLDGAVVGVISLAVFEGGMHRELLEKGTQYRLFLEQMAGLVAAKAAEYRGQREHLFAMNLQMELLSHISDGVLVFDRDKKLILMNQKAEQVLGNTFAQLAYLAKIRQYSIKRRSGRRADGQVEYTVRMRERRVSLAGCEYPVLVEGAQQGAVFVFQDATVLSRALLGFQERQSLSLDGLAGQSPSFNRLREEARLLACRDVSLLLRGETGAGKETLARAIHNESGRMGPFVSVTADSDADSLFARAFWDTRTGAAENEKVNHLSMAEDGTIFIDEIGDLPSARQAKLMELLHAVRGGNVRFIASTCQDLEEKMRRGDFRQDLYYSFVPSVLTVPPLRERPGDVPLLLDAFLQKYGLAEGKHVALAPDAQALFEACRWPGNVRQLEKMAGLCVSTQTHDCVLTAASLPPAVREGLRADAHGAQTLSEVERQLILRLLGSFGTSVEGKRRVARELGISVATLYRKLGKYASDPNS